MLVLSNWLFGSKANASDYLHSLLHFRAREATDLSAAQRAVLLLGQKAVCARGCRATSQSEGVCAARLYRTRLENEVRGPSLMPLPAPGALHRDPFTAAGGIHFLHRDASDRFIHEHPSGIRVDEAAPPAALAIYRDRS